MHRKVVLASLFHLPRIFCKFRELLRCSEATVFPAQDIDVAQQMQVRPPDLGAWTHKIVLIHA